MFHMIPWVFNLVYPIHTISFFLRSFYQEFSNDDDDDDDDDDDEAEEEKAHDLHELMTADTDNIFNFMSYFC